MKPPLNCFSDPRQTLRPASAPESAPATGRAIGSPSRLFPRLPASDVDASYSYLLERSRSETAPTTGCDVADLAAAPNQDPAQSIAAARYRWIARQRHYVGKLLQRCHALPAKAPSCESTPQSQPKDSPAQSTTINPNAQAGIEASKHQLQLKALLGGVGGEA